MSQTLHCPNCDAALTEFRVHKYATVHACHPGCSRIWAERDVLRRIDHLTKGDLSAIRDVLLSLPTGSAPTAVQRNCPHGHGDLIARSHDLVPTVEIDLCPRCDGVFLDAGELAVIRERPLTGREYMRHRRRSRDRAKTLEDNSSWKNWL